MVGEGSSGDIGFWVGVTDGVSSVLWNKIVERVKNKVQNTVV